MLDEPSQKLDTFTNTLRLPLPRLAESLVYARGHELRVLCDPSLPEACGTSIAFTFRCGGMSEGAFASLNLSTNVVDEPTSVEGNRRLVVEAFGKPEDFESLVCPEQVHGCEVIEVDDVGEAQAAAARGADGIVCGKADVPVLLCFADCVPVILVAPNGAFSVLHAGWRGALGGIPGKGLAMLAKGAGCDPGEVNCYIGVHIQSCCYEVSKELLDEFVATYGKSCDAGDSHLDLDAAVISSLISAGASAQRVCSANICTACHTEFFYSHRAEAGHTGRHGAFAMRRGKS